MAAGEGFSLAVRSDGTIWAWGHNFSGRLGNDSSESSPTPVRVKGLTGATAVAAGNYHSLALAPDQEVPLPVQSIGSVGLAGLLGLVLLLGRHRPALVRRT